VPTGLPDRHLILTVEAFDAAGNAVSAGDGPTLPAVAGAAVAGRPGRLFAKLLRAFDGHAPAPFWRADPDVTDTRLHPGQPEHAVYRFPPGVARVRARLLYRRFWPEVAAVKGWPDNEWVVTEQSVVVAR
jgi:hypothetical protein